MSKVVVLGLEGENSLWVANLEAGTVTAVASATADELRGVGQIASRGVSFATVVEAAQSPSGGFMDK